jgi:formylglycine-generating enzyme required for sulfatase activity
MRNEMQLAHLRDLVLEADGGAYEQLLPWFEGEPDQAADLVKKELARKLLPNASEKEKDELAKRQAHAAVVLLQLDQRDDHILPLPQAGCIWEMLREGPDPRLRTYLIHRLGRVGVDPETLIRQYGVEQDVSVRRALLLSLGEFDLTKLPAAKRQALVPRLLQDYRTDPDAGLHSAADWLLHRWEQGEAVQKIDLELAGQPQGERRWYVTKHHGHTLTVFPGDVTFAMGSPDGDPHKGAGEKLHQREIPRSFAVATKEVTVKQFEAFLRANPAVAARFQRPFMEKYSPDPDGPVVGVTWLEAIQYCRWLSEQEGVPPDQMCYPSVADIERSKDGKTPLQLPADYLKRTGYRLPTEAEWEYACRAGTATSRFYGEADALLEHYAWYIHNSGSRAHPVGTKKPNDYGLFDMYGNAWEWCQDVFAPYPDGGGKEPVQDCEDGQPFSREVSRVLRGGGFFSPAPEARSAYRFEFPPHLPQILGGLRVAQTCR